MNGMSNGSKNVSFPCCLIIENTKTSYLFRKKDNQVKGYTAQNGIDSIAYANASFVSLMVTVENDVNNFRGDVMISAKRLDVKRLLCLYLNIWVSG